MGGPGPVPLGAGGIVAWSPDFEKTWELDPEAGLVCDCYALNVTPAGEVLACPYRDFPVVRIRDRQVTVTPANSISGPAGIIASGERAAIVGTYQDPSLLITGTVQDGAFRESDRIHLQAPDGAPLPMARVHCRTWRISGRSALAGHHLQVFRQPPVYHSI